MPGLTDWFEVFRCGTHVDRFGREVTITPSDIDTAIATYKRDSAPIVVGHPTLNAPAFGWIGAFRRVGDIVQAKASSVADEFADIVKRHLYKNRSLAFGPGMRFRHVGFLGAQPPAVKGLKDIQFSDKEEFMDIEFSEDSAQSPVDEHSDAPTHTNEDSALNPAPAVSDKSAEVSDITDELVVIKAELAKAKEATKRLEERNAQLKADYDKASRSLRQAEFATYTDELIAEGRLPKEQREHLLEFMECLHGMNSYEFSEGSMPVLQRFKEIFRAFSKRPVQLTEFASSDKALSIPSSDPVAISRLARAYMDSEEAQGRKISASQAVNHIMKG